MSRCDPATRTCSSQNTCRAGARIEQIEFGGSNLQRSTTDGAKTRARRIGLLAARAGQQGAGLGCWRVARGSHVHRYIHWLAPAGHGDSERGCNAGGLNGVELAYAPRHEEAFDYAQNRGDPSPTKAAVKNPQAGAAQIEVVKPAECLPPRRGVRIHTADRRWLADWDMARCSWAFSLYALAFRIRNRAQSGSPPGSRLSDA
jgi:hypothetical protein